MADRRYTINCFTVNLDVDAGIDSMYSRSKGGATIELVARRLLDLLAEYDIRVTFFATERLMDRFPSVIREAVEQRHETAILVPRFATPLDQLLHLREHVALARRSLEDLTGKAVKGIRLTPVTSGWRSPAMLETLVQEGFEWSSSTIPRQSIAPLLLSTAKRAHRLTTPSGCLWELPLTAWRPLGIGIPSINTSGGPRFGILPSWAIARGVEGMNRHGEPAILYVIAFENARAERIDAWSPDSSKSRCPSGFAGADKLRAIFQLFRFGSIAEAFASRLTTGSTAGESPRRTSIVRSSSEDQAG